MAIDIEEFQSLASAEEHSAQTISRLTIAVTKIQTLVPELIDVIVVGSYGRGESTQDVSDLEWIVIYDDKLVAREEAVVVQSDLTKCFAREFGRERLSIGKTFGEVAALSALLTNSGHKPDADVQDADVGRGTDTHVDCTCDGHPWSCPDVWRNAYLRTSPAVSRNRSRSLLANAPHR